MPSGRIGPTGTLGAVPVRTTRLFPAVALALVSVAACGDDPSPEEQRAELVADLAASLVVETDGAIDDTQATCVATRLIDAIGAEAFEATILAAATDDSDQELQLQVIDTFSECNALGAVLEAAQKDDQMTDRTGPAGTG